MMQKLHVEYIIILSCRVCSLNHKSNCSISFYIALSAAYFFTLALVKLKFLGSTGSVDDQETVSASAKLIRQEVSDRQIISLLSNLMVLRKDRLMATSICIHRN